MPIDDDDFRRAARRYDSLRVLTTDRPGRITAVSVTIGGIAGASPEDTAPVAYDVLAPVRDLETGLPMIWIARPPDSEIRHVNIFRAGEACPFTERPLPTLCWGRTRVAWAGLTAAERRLANLLEAIRQLLGTVNPLSIAR